MNLTQIYLQYAYNASLIFTTSQLDEDASNLKDKQLLMHIQFGAPEKREQAIEILFERHAQYLLERIEYKTYNSDLAMDILLDAWEIVLIKIDNFEWQGVPIRHWIAHIIDYKCLEYQRISKDENHAELDVESYHHEKHLVYIESKLELDQPTSTPTQSEVFVKKANLLLAEALAQLPEDQQIILNQIYYKGLNSTEIGRMLDMKPATVRQKHKRAKENIQKYVERHI